MKEPVTQVQTAPLAEMVPLRLTEMLEVITEAGMLEVPVAMPEVLVSVEVVAVSSRRSGSEVALGVPGLGRRHVDSQGGHCQQRQATDRDSERPIALHHDLPPASPPRGETPMPRMVTGIGPSRNRR
jgi:hypothetical protein